VNKREREEEQIKENIIIKGKIIMGEEKEKDREREKERNRKR